MGPGTIRKRWETTDADAPGCEGYNCECNSRATVEIQGETDSFGYETICLCTECYQKMLNEAKSEKEKFFEENRDIAPGGQVWLSVADVNDGSDWWMTFSKDKAQVLWERQQADARYGSRGGLYRPSLELVGENYANAIYDRWCDRFNDDYDEGDDDDWEDEDWDDDDRLDDDDYYDDEQ